ncbi:MAG: radical SAM protein [Candidatus Aenigmarchaeota archaeon]|nr:radical SAM protein [Candidatus Aenigmarchaeota archaeon]
MSQEPKKQISIIAKPTNDCNLACTYCYIDPKSERGEMDETTLWNMTSKSLQSYDSVEFIWHGGEPLLMPLGFYAKAVEFQQMHSDKQVRNGFQTNGTLVTNDVLDFCERYDFKIGFSLDGPECVNNGTRCFPNGQGAFEQTIGAVRKAKQRGLGSGIIVVVSKLNKDKLGEIYDFAKSEGLGLKLNPLIKSGRALKAYGDLGLEPQEYGRIMIDLFDRWFYDTSAIGIETFEELMGNLLTGIPFGCNYSQSCQNSFISVGVRGDIYPCTRFDGACEFKLGNINTDDLNGVLESEKRQWLRDRVLRVKECLPCDYRQVCNSGCMHGAYMQTGDIDRRDYYCAGYKMLFSHITQRVEAELTKAEVKQYAV